MIKGIFPRDYQQAIFNTCKEKNCLVVLPTGIGKTLIALMLAAERLEKFPTKKVLFLAPTRPLAEQHLTYFLKHIEFKDEINLFTGKINANAREKLWDQSSIIFSTPQCISNDLKNNLYTLEEVSLLIEDECHRCLKNYAYTYIAEKYSEQAPKEIQRILGLTASPGTEKSTIEQISRNLGIEAIEIRTRESEDVKEYIQDLHFETIQLDFPPEFATIRNHLKTIYDKKVEELKNRKLLFGPTTKKALLELQARLMRALYGGSKNFNSMAGVSACALAIKVQHAIELLETQTLYSFHIYLQSLFEQAQKGQSKAVQQLVKNPEFNKAYLLLLELLAKKVEHPKLEKLKEIVSEEIKKNANTKLIIFSQYRDSVTKICKELNSIHGVRAKVFVGQAKKTSGIKGQKQDESGLSQKEQKELIEEFSEGKINILCSTSIGEEGLDIPEVNSVIFYEPVPSAIRKIQRAGRTARKIEGNLIILLTKKTRDEVYHWVAFNKEKKMHSAIKSIQEDMANGKTIQNKTQEEQNQKKLF